MLGHTGKSPASMHCLCIGGKQTNECRLGDRLSNDGFGVGWTRLRSVPRGFCSLREPETSLEYSFGTVGGLRERRIQAKFMKKGTTIV